VSSTTSAGLPALPYPEFPLRPHRNGHWYKSVWNRRTKKSEQFYFGSWQDDPKGKRAMSDPEIGWLARRDPIKAGIDNPRVTSLATEGLSLGDLMARFLVFKRDKVKAGELSLATLGDYLREIELFVDFMKPTTPAGSLKPEHFAAYMEHLTSVRKLGRHARKRIRAYATAMLRYAAENSWIALPAMGTSWAAPSTDRDSMRQAKARAGIKDNSERIVTGEEIDRLLERANPTFKALILLGVNCGLRHSFRTYAKRAHDRESVDLMMGHADGSSSRTYDHDEICWRRIRRVATIVRHRLWPELKRKAGKQQHFSGLRIAADDGSAAA
jgi:hypothetical protein